MSENEAPKLAGRLRRTKSEPNRTPQIEPRWFKPLENDSILIIFFVLPVLLLERGAVTQHAAGGRHVQTDSVGSRRATGC